MYTSSLDKDPMQPTKTDSPESLLSKLASSTPTIQPKTAMVTSSKIASGLFRKAPATAGASTAYEMGSGHCTVEQT